MAAEKLVPGGVRRSLIPNLFDVAALCMVIGILVALTFGAHETTAPIESLQTNPVTLDPANLPVYALRTVLRMLIALVCSVVFTLIYAPIAAKSRRAGMVMIPILDILQSVPILGFLTFLVVFFTNLFPNQVLGAELASIFAIFTSQAWNMTFSLYQSLRTLPKDLEEACDSFHLSWWQRFWTLEIPYAMPGLVWNTMMSMSGGWFFVVASEAITVGDNKFVLPGIGSYVTLAINTPDLTAVFYALATMLVVIFLYDQFLFRPIVAWSNKFRFEDTALADEPESWLLNLFRKTKVLRLISSNIGGMARRVQKWRLYLPRPKLSGSSRREPSKIADGLWFLAVTLLSGYAAYVAIHFMAEKIALDEVWQVILFGSITMVRVVALIILATIIWVPIGVWIGLRPKIADRIQPLVQFFAAFPADIAFPAFVFFIVMFHLNPDIWLSPLMILGTQWYILFNVIAGASAFPSNLREAADSFHVKGWPWWRNVILPGIFPYYVTGAITASGGSWNASIVAEVAKWGDTKLTATGIGSYIAGATDAGDFQRLTLGVVVMCVFVMIFNRFVWRPLYAYAERHFKLG